MLRTPLIRMICVISLFDFSASCSSSTSPNPVSWSSSSYISRFIPNSFNNFCTLSLSDIVPPISNTLRRLLCISVTGLGELEEGPGARGGAIDAATAEAEEATLEAAFIAATAEAIAALE